MKKLGIVVTQCSIYDINATIDAVNIIFQNTSNIHIYLFAHSHAIQSSFLNPLTGECSLIEHGKLPLFKEKNNCPLFNASAILASADLYSDKVNLMISKISGVLDLDKDFRQDALIPVQNRVVFRSAFNPCDGYGSSAEQMVYAIDQHTNYQVIFHPFNVTNTHLAIPRVKQIYDQSREFKIERHKVIPSHYIHYAQPHHRISNPFLGKSVCFTMWESSRTPPAWGIYAEGFTEMWTPSEWGANVMRNCGIRRPVRVVPLGVNIEVFKFKQLAEPKDKFRFLVYANAHYENDRKNYRLILEAFKRTFGNSKDVELILKITTGGSPTDLPSNVKIINNRCSNQELCNLLHSANAFIFISAGEGFGLPCREAMSAGVPIVLGNTSALRDIAIEDLCFPVQPTKTIPAHGYPLSYGHVNELGVFDAYSVNDVVDQLKAIYKNYGDALLRAKNAANFIHNNQTYKHTAMRIKELLDE